MERTATAGGDRDDMLGSLRRSVDAFNAGDLEGHVEVYDESVTYMTQAGPRLGPATIVSSFRARFLEAGRPTQALREEETSIRFLSPDSALMAGRYVLSGGRAPDSTGWFTLVWLRTEGAWKVVHDHSS
jgi:uncharacterized protein (TIGR02246 family)